MPRRGISRGYLLAFVVVAGAYLGAGKGGIELSVARFVITPVWAPSGIAVAALLLGGMRLWPAVTLGAFLANVTSGTGAPIALGIAVGNTLEPLAATYLLRRSGFRPALDRVRDVLTLVGLSALLSTTIAATGGTSLLSLDGSLRGSYGSGWLLWWFGDGTGVLMVAPLILVAASHLRWRPSRLQLLEAAAGLAALGAASGVVFFAGYWRYPYLVFPLLIWAALRFRQLGAAVASLVVGAMGTAGALTGHIPISAGTSTERVQIVQACVGILAVSLLIVGASLAERHRSLEELALTAARLAEAQELTHIGSWDWDVATSWVVWSDELFRIYGLDPQSVGITYEGFLERVHPDDRERVRAIIERAYVDHQPFAFEHRVVLPSGGVRLLHARGQVAIGEDGTPQRMFGTGQDITERKQAEALREDILSTVSHELRTPLTSVLGFALTLQERWSRITEESARQLVEHIVGQAQRLDRLLGDLLDVERLRRGVLTPRRQPTHVAFLLEQVAALYASEEHPIQVFAEPVVANVDANKLERIIENLLANAVRHTPPGTPVEARLEPNGEDLLLSVDDRGPGIPDELKAGVFELFNRGSKMLTSEPGTGIGLALVARFAALHDGKAWVEDGREGGSSFRVLLPNCVVAEEPATTSV